MKSKRLIIKIESLLNKTPNIGILFIIGIFLTIVLSAIVASLTDQFVFVSVDPETLQKQQSVFEVKNYLIPANFLSFVSGGLYSFSSFSSTVTVLVTIIAFGIAEKSGFIYTVLKKLLFNIPNHIVTILLVLIGILSNVTSSVELNAGYVFLLPLSAFIYMGNGRNPLAGIATMFAAIFGAYNINILLTSHTLLLNEITETVVKGALPKFEISGADTRYIMMVLVVISTFIIVTVTEKYIVNILPLYELDIYTYHRITDEEKRGLYVAVIYTIISGLGYVYFLMPKHIIDLPGSGLLIGSYNPDNVSYLTQLLQSPLFTQFAIHLSYYFIVAGTLYGIFSKKFASFSDLIKSSVVSVADNAEYFVLAFLISQFMFVMYDSNLALLFIIKLTALIPHSGSLVAVALITLLVVAIANIIVPSSVTKWTIIAPVILPFFVSNLINPVFAQTVFQVADSATNSISVFMPYTIYAYVLFNVYAKKTKQHCGNGTYFKLTVPYSLALLGTYFIIVALWVGLNIDLGPGVQLFL